jgi:hypothetical protein
MRESVMQKLADPRQIGFCDRAQLDRHALSVIGEP